MHTSRKRTHFTNAGLLTAVTLSMCLLAGCNGARFMMGGDPNSATPNTPSQVGTSGTTPAAQPRTLNLEGVASLFDAPMGNASVKVFDAISGRPAQVIAAGGGNVIAAGGGNVVAAGGANYGVAQAGSSPVPQVGAASFSTDAEGKFSIAVGNMVPGMVIRLVVTQGDQSVSTLVTGSGQSLSDKPASAYAVQTVVFDNAQAGFVPVRNVAVNPITHATTVLSHEIFGLTSPLTPFARQGIIDTTFSDIYTRFYAPIERSPLPEFLLEMTRNLDDKFLPPLEKVDLLVKSYNLADDQLDIRKKNETSVAQQKSNPANLAGGADGGTNGEQPNTGEQPSTGEQPQDPDGITEDPNAGTGDPNVAPVVSSSNFDPTVLVKRTPNLTIKVSQPLRSDDISTVYARVAKASGMSLNTAIDSTSSINVNASALGTFTFTWEATASKAVALPPRFGGGTLSSTTMSYNLKKPGMTSPVAHFQVFETASYYYLVTSYKLSDAVRTNGGHTTVLSSTALSGLTDATKIEITLTSRGGNSVDRTNGVTDVF